MSGEGTEGAGVEEGRLGSQAGGVELGPEQFPGSQGAERVARTFKR